MAFPYTVDSISLWELAHRLAGKNPYRPWFLPIPIEAKDAIRSLMHEILAGRLDSSLIYEKRKAEGPPILTKLFYIRTHIDKFYKCIGGHSFPRFLLKFIQIEKEEFGYWCDETGYSKPDFWFSFDVEWTYEDYRRYEDWIYREEGIAIDSQGKVQHEFRGPDGQVLNERGQIKYRCRLTARQIWEKDPNRPILDVAGSEELEAIAGHYTVDTRRKWIRVVAPEHLRNRRGRPKKDKSDNNQ